LDALKHRGLVSETKHSFARHFLETKHSRGLLQKAWPALRLLLPRLPRVKAGIARHKVEVHIFAGRHDRIIHVADALAFAKGAPNVQLHVLDKGHWLLDDETIRDASRALLG
jgi:pimeloyl-ACP methyl ester carboxylesterase